MNFQPLVPLGGLPGWVLLNNTLERQTEVFNKSPQIVRDTDYFEQTIGKIETAEQLVSDRRLLRVALGAFGLGDDLNSQALIQRVLEDGTADDDALANRLTDARYKKLSDAFGFGGVGFPRTQLGGFGREITEKYRSLEFEVAVGEQDESLRLAMNTQRELAELVSSDDEEDTKWFSIMGNPPLRKVFEVALGLPTSFGQIDIDRQLETFKTMSRDQLDIESLSELADPDTTDSFIRRYLLREQVASIQVLSSGTIALTLLQNAAVTFQ